MKQEAFDRVSRYIVENQNSFYRLAYSYLKNREDALDAVQDAVCKALENCTGLRDQEAMRTWFYRILVNECLSLLRSRGRIQTEDSEGLEIPYEEKGFEHHDDIDQMLLKLDQDTQTIIKLRFFEELSLSDVSDVMGLNLNTVKSKLYRGLRQLRVNIEEVGL